MYITQYETVYSQHQLATSIMTHVKHVHHACLPINFATTYKDRLKRNLDHVKSSSNTSDNDLVCMENKILIRE